jgi:hypothetical protein
MTNLELQELLKQYPDDLPICRWTKDNYEDEKYHFHTFSEPFLDWYKDEEGKEFKCIMLL